MTTSDQRDSKVTEMYETLIEYLSKLDNSDYGKWHVDTEHKGTEEDSFHMPFVGYERIVIDLEHAIYDFVDIHPEVELTKYSEILEQNGLEWGTDSMEQTDVSSLDGRAVMALLVGVLRADRFCEGVLLGFLNSGTMNRWLERLKEIDEDQ
jgi:hypothetical protein